MLGYTANIRWLRDKLIAGLLLLALFPRLETQAQSERTLATGTSNQTRAERKERRRAERAFVLVGAGDIAGCQNLEGARATAKLIEQIPGTVFARSASLLPWRLPDSGNR